MAKEESNFYDNLMGDEGTPSPTDSDVNNALAAKGQEHVEAEASASEEQGQEADSPTAKTSEPVDEGAKKEETPASEEEGTKPAPYDQDPKWKSARAAEARLTEILEKNGFETPEDLETALDSGKSLKEILGSRDAEKLIADSDTLSKAVAKRDAENARQREEGETESETIARLKKDNDDLRTFNRKQEDDRLAIIDNDNALSSFNERIAGMVEAEEGMSSSEKTMLNLFLGVDNPINDVDLANASEINKTTKSGIKNFQNLVNAIKQSAVDEYATGNSKITPMSKTQTGKETKSVKKTELSKNASVDETFDSAKAEMLEIFSNIDMEELFDS